jgi:hypothetical protein
MEKLERLLTQLINSHNQKKKRERERENLSLLLGQRKMLHSLSPGKRRLRKKRTVGLKTLNLKPVKSCVTDLRTVKICIAFIQHEKKNPH